MMSGSTTTIALMLVAVGAVVYFVGIDSTRMAAARTGSRLRSTASRQVAAGAAGAGVGLQFGADLFNAVLAEPGFALTAVAGIMGGLGIGGFLGEISALQFLLIGFVAFLVVYSLFGGDD